MSIDLKHKLHSLLASWPDGTLRTTSWFRKHDYSDQLLRKYCQYGWLKSLGYGAYAKLEDTVEWSGAVNALQEQLKFSLHLGGVSALELFGVYHYVAMQRTHPYLFNTTATRRPLPKWFISHYPYCIYRQQHLFIKEIGLETKLIKDIPIVASVPERAVLEMLSLIPQSFSYEHAYEITQSLRLLRPNLLQQLLEQCRMVKVKRLFLYFAEIAQLPCFEKLQTKKIFLGHGKRQIGAGGKYIAQYQLSVPTLPEEEEEKGAGYV